MRRGVAGPLVWFDGGVRSARWLRRRCPLQRLKSPPIERMVEGRMELVWLWSSKSDKESSFLESNESKFCKDGNK